MSHPIPALEEFLGGNTAPQYVGPVNPGTIPTRDGRTPGTTVGRYHSQPTTVMHICGEDGKGFPVDLAQLSQDKVARAMVPPSAQADATDAAIATFHRLASGQSRPSAPPPPNPAYTGVVVTPLGQPQASGPQPQRRRATPMGQPEAAPLGQVAAPPPAGPGFVDQGARPTRPTLVAPPPLSGQVAPPTQQVTFEIPGYGPLDAFYHQVIRTGDHLVLVFDKRHVGNRSFPRHSNGQLGMRVHGTDNLFMVQTTGIEFELDSKALCLLSVVSEGSYNAYLEQSDPLARQMNAVPFLPEHASGETRSYPAGGDAPGDDEFGGHDHHPGV